jgi:hypothetical protein
MRSWQTAPMPVEKWIDKGPSPLAEATDEACGEFPQNRAQLDSGKK